MLIINKDILHEMYIDRGMTDKEIALELNVDRTYVSRLRKKYNISTRKYTGFIGEDIVKDKLKEMNILYEDMNEISKDYIYDLNALSLRIEVKSAKQSSGKRFIFTLTEQKSNGKKESENRIILNNGKTRKLFQKTCDLFIFVCIDEHKKNNFYLIPSKHLPENIQCLSLNPYSNRSKFNCYLENWSLLTVGGGGK